MLNVGIQATPFAIISVSTRVELGRIGFPPQVPRPAEAVALVVVVVGRGEILRSLEGGVRDAVPVLERGHAEGGRVAGVGLLDAHMMGDLEAELLRLVDGGLHDVAVHAEDLDPVHALLLERADGLADLVGRRAGRGLVEIEARRGDRAFLALASLGEGFLHVAPDVADRRDPARQPDLVFVLERLGDPGPLVLEMDVAVDEAGEKVHARAVEDVRLGLVSVRPRIRPPDGGDLVALEDDVHGPARRRALAVDDHDIPDDEPVGPLAVLDSAALGRERRPGEQSAGLHRKEKYGSMAFSSWVLLNSGLKAIPVCAPFYVDARRRSSHEGN